MALLCGGATFLTVSCENEIEEMDMKTVSARNAVGLAIGQDNLVLNLPPDYGQMSENLRNAIVGEAVAPSECYNTQFVAVQRKYAVPLVADPVAIQNYSLYTQINQIYSYFFDRGEQYFGAGGEYTQLMTKRTRELEKFWNMPGEIIVNGQHVATLENREALADVIEAFAEGVTSREQAYAIADVLLAENAKSPLLPESPYFSLDGFATPYDNLIVIGDGLVQMVSESGVDADIVWTGVLAHEWAHQIQFKNMGTWYPNGAAADPAEDTRYTELEADFLAAYYMTHKRGATYNSKRVAQFFELFFQVGDCGFSSPTHHGTPLQRMAAAQLGFNLADNAQKQGHIMSIEEAHRYFVANVGKIVTPATVYVR
ncbi:neutral zinc metallopeptidase [Rufibacter hautae]|nr:neutral zinc metallopeptidase [Rufibacter hautae]